MGKFTLKCPSCGTGNEASTFLFAKKNITCIKCGTTINVKESRMTSKKCPHCHEHFVYDQAKTTALTCPFCSKEVDALAKDSSWTINCPQCACTLELEEHTGSCTCPICDFVIDAKTEIAKQQQKAAYDPITVRYEGDNSVFVWKHPMEDFRPNTEIVVQASQEAVVLFNGRALNPLPAGSYLLSEIVAVPAERYHVEVYYVNKAVHMSMKWGTDSRIRFIDPATAIPLDIGASGELNLQVVDSLKLLLNLVGTTKGLSDKQILSHTSNQSDEVHRSLKSFFRAPLMTVIKSYLASVIKAQRIDIMEIDEKMGLLSEALLEQIVPCFADYGLTVRDFFITTISLPEDDENFIRLRELRAAAYIDVQDEQVRANVAEAAQRRKILEAQTEAQLAAIRAQGEAEAIRARGLAEAQVMAAQGYSQQDLINADVQKAYAEALANGSAQGNPITAAMNAVTGAKIASVAFESMNFGATPPTATSPAPAPTAAAPTPTAPTMWTCECGEAENTKGFCMNCGKPKPLPANGKWTCSCGETENTKRFCMNCGAERK